MKVSNWKINRALSQWTTDSATKKLGWQMLRAQTGRGAESRWDKLSSQDGCGVAWSYVQRLSEIGMVRLIPIYREDQPD